MEHLSANFSGLHRAKLRRGTAAARPSPRGTGDIYYAEDTGELSIADATGSSWNTYNLSQIGTVSQLSDLTDVLSAVSTANYVLAAPDGSSGDYSGRALTANDIPNLSVAKFSGTLGETAGGLGMTGYSAGDLIVSDGANSLSVLPLGSDGQWLTIDTALSPPLKWAAIGGGGGSTNFQGARVYNSSGQSINNTTATPLIWTTEVYDVGGLWAAGNPERMTIQADGKYHTSVHLYMPSDYLTPDEATWQLSILLVSTARGWSRTYAYGPAAFSLSCALDCVATDYIYARLWQSTGGSVTLGDTLACGFMVEKIS